MTQLNVGWNLVNSFGFYLSLSELIANSDDLNVIGPIYKYNNGNYEEIDRDDKLTILNSYWIFCARDSVNLVIDIGITKNNLSYQIYNGWNLITCPSDSSMTLLDIFGNNIDNVTALVKRENNNYINVDLNNDSVELEPSIGYWVYVSEDMDLSIGWGFDKEYLGFGNYGNEIFAGKNIFFSSYPENEVVTVYPILPLEQKTFTYPFGLGSLNTTNNKYKSNKQSENIIISYDDSLNNDDNLNNNDKKTNILQILNNQNTIYLSNFLTQSDLNLANNLVWGGRINNNIRLVFINKNNNVSVLKLNSSNEIELKTEISFENPESLAITPDGNVIAIGNNTNIILYGIYSNNTPERIGNIFVGNSNYMNMALSGNGKSIAFTTEKSIAFTTESKALVYRYKSAFEWELITPVRGLSSSKRFKSIDIDYEGTTVVCGNSDLKTFEIFSLEKNNGSYSWRSSSFAGSNDESLGESVSINNNFIAVGDPESNEGRGKIDIYKKKKTLN